MAVWTRHGSDESEGPEILARVLAGPFGYLAGQASISEPGAVAGLSLARLLEPSMLRRALDRYADGFVAADPRSVASLWSQYCFGLLIVPFVAISLLGRRVPPVSLESVELALEDGRPSRLVLPHIGRPTRCSDAFVLFAPLVRGQIAPVIARLVDSSGASPRLFWGNAAAILDWALHQAATMLPAPRDPGPLRDSLLHVPTWPDGEPNPLFGTLRTRAGTGEQCQRRVCCVRYILPGVPGCGPFCPLGR